MTRHLRRSQRASDRSWFLLSCGSEAQTQVVRLDSKCGNLLSHQTRSPLTPPIALLVPSTEASKFATRSMMLFFLTRASPNLLCDIASLSIYVHTLGIFIYLFTHFVLSLCVCVWAHVPRHTCGSPRTITWGGFFSAMWVPGIELRSSGLQLICPPSPALHLDVGFLCWSLFNA